MLSVKRRLKRHCFLLYANSAFWGLVLFSMAVGSTLTLFFCIAIRERWIDSEKARMFLKTEDVPVLSVDYGMLIHIPRTEDGKRKLYYSDIENVMYIHQYFAEAFECSMERVMIKADKNKFKLVEEEPDVVLSTAYINPSVCETLAQQKRKWKKRGWVPLLDFAKAPEEFEKWCEKVGHYK